MSIIVFWSWILKSNSVHLRIFNFFLTLLFSGMDELSVGMLDVGTAERNHSYASVEWLGANLGSQVQKKDMDVGGFVKNQTRGFYYRQKWREKPQCVGLLWRVSFQKSET